MIMHNLVRIKEANRLRKLIKKIKIKAKMKKRKTMKMIETKMIRSITIP